jgi:hypothetical protein
MHVYFLPLRFFVIPALLQIAPALGDTAAITGASGVIRSRATRKVLDLTKVIIDKLTL